MCNIFFKSFGCKVNQLENEALKKIYLSQGYLEVYDIMLADLLVVSSCTVTHTAQSKLIKYVRKGLKSNSNLKVKIYGCFLPEAIERLKNFADRVEFHDNSDKFDFLGSQMPNISTMSEHTRTFIKIQEGCNAFCSYCIIPFLRPKIYSRPMKDIIENIKQSITEGKKEIVLVGINLGLWKDENLKLTDLLKVLIAIEGTWRLRLSSLEVSDLTPDLIELLDKNDKFVPHLHISAQSGSSKIIKSMNRKYSKEDILRKISEIRAVAPFAGLSADFIVGFPGETDKDFQDSLDVIVQGEFIRIHAFPFSSRTGTKASNLPAKVQPEIIKQREKILVHKSIEVRNKFLTKLIGRNVQVLIEEVSPNLNQAKGYSGEYIPTIVNNVSSNIINTFIKGEVKQISPNGELII